MAQELTSPLNPNFYIVQLSPFHYFTSANSKEFAIKKATDLLLGGVAGPLHILTPQFVVQKKEVVVTVEEVAKKE